MKPLLASTHKTDRLLRIAARNDGVVGPLAVIREMELDYQTAAQALDRLVDQGLLSKIPRRGLSPGYQLTCRGYFQLRWNNARLKLRGLPKIILLLPGIALVRWLATRDRHLWRHWDVNDWENWRRMRFAWGLYALAVAGWLLIGALGWLICRCAIGHQS